MSILENWSVVIGGVNPYLAPELIKSRLQGKIFNDKRFDDGEQVTTSSIIGKRGNLVITKSGTEYELGKVDPEYEKLFPNARNRIFDNLSEI